MRSHRICGMAFVALGSLSQGCVPEDGEVEHFGGVTLDLLPSRATAQDIGPTLDGWKIHIDRAVVSLTSKIISVEHESCWLGSSAVSTYVFDGTQPFEQLFIRTLRPGSRCKVGFIPTLADISRTTNDDSVLLQTGTRPYPDARSSVETLDFASTNQYALALIGTAKHDDQTILLNVKIRAGIENPAESQSFLIKAEESATFHGTFRAEQLFSRTTGGFGGLAFQGFRIADELGNRDGIVTTNELDKLSMDSLTYYYVPHNSGPEGFGNATTYTFSSFLTSRLSYLIGGSAE